MLQKFYNYYYYYADNVYNNNRRESKYPPPPRRTSVYVANHLSNSFTTVILTLSHQMQLCYPDIFVKTTFFLPSTCQTLQNNTYVKDVVRRKPNTNMNNTLLKEEICQLGLCQSVPNDKSAIYSVFGGVELTQRPTLKL